MKYLRCSIDGVVHYCDTFTRNMRTSIYGPWCDYAVHNVLQYASKKQPPSTKVTCFQCMHLRALRNP